MLQKSRFFMVMLVALLALGLVLMGCSDGGDPDPTPGPGQNPDAVNDIFESGALDEAELTGGEFNADGFIEIQPASTSPYYDVLIVFDEPIDISGFYALSVEWEGINADLAAVGFNATITTSDTGDNKIVLSAWVQDGNTGTDSQGFPIPALTGPTVLEFSRGDANADPEDGTITFDASNKQCVSIGISITDAAHNVGSWTQGVEVVVDPMVIKSIAFIGIVDDDDEDDPPAGEPPVLPVVFENGLWAAGLNVETGVDPKDSAVYLIQFVDVLDVSAYSSATIEFASLSGIDAIAWLVDPYGLEGEDDTRNADWWDQNFTAPFIVASFGDIEEIGVLGYKLYKNWGATAVDFEDYPFVKITLVP